MFGVETRVWSLTTPASGLDVLAVLDRLPEPTRREWLAPGALAPVARLRRDADGAYLRLSPGDPRRGPGSADRAYLTVRPGEVEVAQRPTRAVQVVLGGLVVGLWCAAALAAVYGLTTGHPAGLVGVPAVLGLRSFVEAGRRLDQRRLRTWLTARVVDAAPAAAGGARRTGFGPPRYDVDPVDCH